MGIKIDKRKACTIVEQANLRVHNGTIGSDWVSTFEEFSEYCSQVNVNTHVAFLGTAILAKAYDLNADLFSIKPQLQPENPSAFSARNLCHSVLVPMSAKMGFSLGVTGREPLNNQPYFRMRRLDDETPVRGKALAAFNFMINIIREIDQIKDEETVLDVLAQYILVRRKYQPVYVHARQKMSTTSRRLTMCIEKFVSEASESGRRAQAVVAGILDVLAGSERVESGRINDPSRKHPGDVIVYDSETGTVMEKAIEVRDKSVTFSDVQIFARKCIEYGAYEAALVMVGKDQRGLYGDDIAEWSEDFGIGVTLFYGWASFVDSGFFWCDRPKHLAASLALRKIEERLVEVEISGEGMARWQELAEAASKKS